MIRSLDKFWAMPFVEQLDLLSQRYCEDMIKYREMTQNYKPGLSSQLCIQKLLKK
ncbi:hypothetical protein MA16_Dca006251 [Dendrobium catenatum]|uniref:Uncharacterized protein n=1 Tax=Dendrobium catenatum TaxID=906689 RepID=A0A2I0W9D3_9ASPA|nr:hypothetical protein MA16_Dca006251 [Dendrobium catenatum]